MAESRIKLFLQVLLALLMGSLGLIALTLSSNQIVDLIKAISGEDNYNNPIFQRIVIMVIVIFITGAVSMFPRKINPSHFNLVV